MRLRSVHLVNMRQHADLKIDLVPGVIGITGHNGAGKSSLLEGLFFGLTGESLTDAPKAELLRWGAKTGQVTVEFTDGAAEWTVTRGLGRNTATLTGPSDKITGITQVNAAMQEYLGTSPMMLKEVLFVAQEQLDAPLLGTDAIRKDGFGRLFGCGRFDKLRDILQNAINTLPNETAPTPAQREAVELAISTLGNQLQEHEKTLAALQEEAAAVDTASLYKVYNAPIRDDLEKRKAALEQESVQAATILAGYTPQETETFDRQGVEELLYHCQNMRKLLRDKKCPFCGHVPEKPPMTEQQLAEDEQTLRHVKERIDLFDQTTNTLVQIDDALVRLGDPSSGVTKEQHEEAEIALAAQKALTNRILQMTADKGRMEATLTSAKRDLDALDVSLEAAKERQRLTDTLVAVRDAMHRDALPQMLRAYGAERLNDHLQTFVSVFNIPYTPFFTTEGLLNFVESTTNTSHDFRELSGGQRKVVALAYRMALVRLFANAINLAILDEPTAYVDKDNVEAMQGAFASLDKFAKARGMTVLVSTHEERLMPVFTRVEKIG